MNQGDAKSDAHHQIQTKRKEQEQNKKKYYDLE